MQSKYFYYQLTQETIHFTIIVFIIINIIIAQSYYYVHSS